MTDDPIAQWYADKHAEAQKARQALKEAEARGASLEEIRRIKLRIEMAEHVGD